MCTIPALGDSLRAGDKSNLATHPYSINHLYLQQQIAVYTWRNGVKHPCEDCAEPTKEIKLDGNGSSWVSCQYVNKCKTVYKGSELTAEIDYTLPLKYK